MKRLKKPPKRPRTSGLLAGCLAAVAMLATASAASAVTYRPTRTDDPAPNGCKKKDCSLREAVIAANASGTRATILLRPGKRYMLTRKGAGEDAALTGDLDISSGPLTVKTEGGGKSNQATIDANRIDRIFDGSLTVNGVTLRDGHARTVAGDAGAGGAIPGDVLDIRNSRLINNTADYHPSNLFVNGSGGAIFVNSGGELRIAETAGDSGAGWPSTRVGSQRSTARPSPATTPAGRVPVAASESAPDITVPKSPSGNALRKSRSTNNTSYAMTLALALLRKSTTAE